MSLDIALVDHRAKVICDVLGVDKDAAAGLVRHFLGCAMDGAELAKLDTLVAFSRAVYLAHGDVEYSALCRKMGGIEASDHKWRRFVVDSAVAALSLIGGN